MIELAALQVQILVLRQLAIIRCELGEIHERLEIMSEQQTHLDSDVQDLNDAAGALEAEVQNLKDQIANGVPAEQLNLAGLDTVTARFKGDVPAAPADGGADVPPTDQPAPAAPADPAPVEQPTGPNETPVDTSTPDASAS